MKKYLFLLPLLLCVNLLFSQDVFQDALWLFKQEKYGLSQNLFHQIYADELSSESQKEDALFHIAICSKNLFNEDAEFWFDEFLSKFPYSEKTNQANYELGLYFFRQKRHEQAADYFSKCDYSSNECYFKLAYSYFVLDSLTSSKYYFSKLLNTESKYAGSAQYFYAHIAYKQRHYKTALAGFLKLKEDEKFSAIVPYYISQIFFLQKTVLSIKHYQ